MAVGDLDSESLLEVAGRGGGKMIMDGFSEERPHQAHETPDEGWWASVLADEAILHPQRVELPPKSEISISYETVDWRRVQQIFEQDEIVMMTVTAFNRGGLLAQGDGIKGFVPISHLVEIPSCTISEDERQMRLAKYVGRNISLKVIECDPSMERIVLSERAARAGEGKRKELFQSLKVGKTITGSVTNITDFGVFVDLGGVEGLIHVSELSWGRVQHPSDVLQVGECVETTILQVCEESARVALSLKRLRPNPWDTILDTLSVGDAVSATITTIMRFGAFARLEEGVEGLIHVSSMAVPGSKRELERAFHVGQRVKVRILHIDVPRRRLGLGLVQAE